MSVCVRSAELRSPGRAALAAAALVCLLPTPAVLTPAAVASAELPGSAAADDPKPQPGTTAVREYRVRPGDTLGAIAARLGLAWDLLYRQNQSVIGRDPSRLLPGQLLGYVLPGQAPAPGWKMPVHGGRVTAPYRLPGSAWAAGYHTGVDLAVPEGKPVYSVGAGTVHEARWHHAYGYHAVVKMTDGHYVLYGHLQRLDVRTGDRIKGGRRLGLAGSTGNATGPHLHFEVRKTPEYGTDVNPVRYLAAHGVWL